MARQLARAIEVLAELADGHWACQLPVDVLNDAARKGLCRVVETGRIYEAEGVPTIAAQIANKKFVAARVAAQASWLVVRVATWTIVANHGQSKDAAQFDADLRNGES